MVDIEKLKALYKFGKDLSLKDAQQLLKASKVESIKKKTILFEQGSKDTKIHYLRKGIVRLFHVKDSGEEITFNIITEYNVVANYEYIGMQRPSSFYYETLEDCSFMTIDFAVFDRIVSSNPKLEANRKFFLRRLLMASDDRVHSFVLMNPEERYKKFIADFPELTNRVPDKYIAQVLGITPVSLSRIRKRIASK